MKIKRYTVRNFQSIQDLTITFKPKGVYIITGVNNSGKSSWARSTASHFYNTVHQQYKKDFIRDGSDFYETETETYEGHVITQRRGSENSYTLKHPNGVIEPQFLKLERGVPEKIRDIFNFYIDPVSKEKLNYRGSRSNLMLVTTSPRETYDLIQYAIKTTEINDAIRRGTSRIKDINADLEIYASNIETLEAQATSITILDLDDVEVAVNSLEHLDSLLSLLSSIIQHFDELDKVNASLSEHAAFVELFDSYGELLKITTATASMLSGYNKLTSITTRLAEIEVIISESNMLTATNQVVRATESYIKHSDTLIELDAKLTESVILIPDEVYQCLNSLKLCASVSNSIDNYARIVTNIKQLDKELVELEATKQNLFYENGYCPFCNSKFDKPHSHS